MERVRRDSTGLNYCPWVPFGALPCSSHRGPEQPVRGSVRVSRGGGATFARLSTGFITLEYAGALPGAFKNLLEWAVGDADVGSIYDKPVGWINVLASPTGAADAYRSLAIVLGYVHAAVVPEACVRIPVTRQMVGSEGLITDPVVRESVTAVLDALVISMGCWPSSKSCTCARTCATEASARRCCSTRWSCAASGTQERCTSTPTRSTLTPGASTSVTGS